MSEVYNGVLKGVQALPLTALITETWNRTLSYFADRVQFANALVGMNKPWCKKCRGIWMRKQKNSEVMV
jgi:hypothetical protein